MMMEQEGIKKKERLREQSGGEGKEVGGGKSEEDDRTRQKGREEKEREEEQQEEEERRFIEKEDEWSYNELVAIKKMYPLMLSTIGLVFFFVGIFFGLIFVGKGM